MFKLSCDSTSQLYQLIINYYSETDNLEETLNDIASDIADKHQKHTSVSVTDLYDEEFVIYTNNKPLARIDIRSDRIIKNTPGRFNVHEYLDGTVTIYVKICENFKNEIDDICLTVEIGNDY